MMKTEACKVQRSLFHSVKHYMLFFLNQFKLMLSFSLVFLLKAREMCRISTHLCIATTVNERVKDDLADMYWWNKCVCV